MRKILTLLLLIFVVSAFAIFTVFILLYAQGKTFDSIVGLVDTGTIRINSNPRNVDVYVNGEERNLVEWTIGNLKPGIVSITIRKEGYYDWSKDIVVEAGVLKDIFAQMIPTTIELTDISTDDISLFIPSNIKEFIYFVTETEAGNTLKKLKVRRDFLDFSDPVPTTIKLLDAQEYALISSSEKLEISQDNTFLLFWKNPIGAMGILNLNNGDVRYISSNLPTRSNKDIAWFRNSTSLLVTTETNLIYEYNLGTETSTIVTDNPDLVYFGDNYIVFKAGDKVSLYENGNVKAITSNLQIAAALSQSNYIYPLKHNSKLFSLVHADKTIEFFDLDKNLHSQSSLTGDIQYQSPDSPSFIIKNEEGLFSISYEYSIADRKYKVIEGKLFANLSNQIDTSDFDFKFYNNHKNILYISDSSIFTSDIDGKNLVELTIPDGYSVVDANITNDNQYIYTVLKDSENQSVKIYKIAIVLKQ